MLPYKNETTSRLNNTPVQKKEETLDKLFMTSGVFVVFAVGLSLLVFVALEAYKVLHNDGATVNKVIVSVPPSPKKK